MPSDLTDPFADPDSFLSADRARCEQRLAEAGYLPDPDRDRLWTRGLDRGVVTEGGRYTLVYTDTALSGWDLNPNPDNPVTVAVCKVTAEDIERELEGSNR